MGDAFSVSQMARLMRCCNSLAVICIAGHQFVTQLIRFDQKAAKHTA